jgi:hypothetical protein
MVPSIPLGGDEDRRLAREHDRGADRNLMIWNAAIYCTQVALDMIMVSLRCTLVYKPRGMERVESMTTPSRDLECLGAISLR